MSPAPVRAFDGHCFCRFTDGRRVKRKFDRVDVVRSLYDYVELEFGVSPKQVIICTTMPRVSCIVANLVHK